MTAFAVILRHDLPKSRLIISLLSVVFGFSGWFIFQRRELKRFYERQDAEEKELKAVEREVELTNVLNLQHDVVVIYSSDELASE